MSQPGDATPPSLLGVIDQLADGKRVYPKTLMRVEMLRFRTFNTYPKLFKPSTIKLAAAGFYYFSEGDTVVCYCCGKRYSDWKEDDIPMEVHKRLNPRCQFVVS